MLGGANVYFEYFSVLIFVLSKPPLVLISAKFYLNIKYIISKKFVQLSIASMLLTLANPIIYKDILWENKADNNSSFLFFFMLLALLFVFALKRTKNTSIEKMIILIIRSTQSIF